MKNKDITRKISQGMYVLTTKGGGCIVDAVSQASAGDNPLITVAVMKKNYTNELIKKNGKFILSVLGKEVEPEIIKTFGLNSMRDIDKFEKTKVIQLQEMNIINDSLGYMICEVVDSIDNDTHTLFIGKLVEGDIFKKEQEVMTYAYYQEHKDELLKVTTKKGKTAWKCIVCGYVYYGEEIPDDYKCPICSVDKTFFKKKEE